MVKAVAMSNANVFTPKSRARIESELERNREEGNWNRCLDLALQMGNDSPQLIHFLTGEAKLEKYLESDKNDGNNKLLLNEAQTHLKACLDSSMATPLSMDANLLLAKLYYICEEYDKALRHIELSGIDGISNVDKALPIRVIKLVAESFAVKGMSLEHKTTNHNYDTRILCLNKATDLGIRYLQNVEKHHGPYIVVSLGPILEMAIEKAPLIYIEKENNLIQAMNQYRRALNACETPSTLNIRQKLAKSLSHLLLTRISRNIWTKCELNTLSSSSKPLTPQRYIGQSLFVPQERDEEIMLLLMISEMLASKNVVIDRNPDYNDQRTKSLNNVTAIYNLMTITLTPYKCYLLDIYERAMKFSFEIKHIWFQFALTLIESKKYPLRALLVLKEVSRIDPLDPLPNLIASKLCLLELFEYKEALELASDALRKCKDLTMFHKINFIIGVSHALIYETETETCKKYYLNHLNESIKYLKEALVLSSRNNLPYFHLALHMAKQRALNDALQYVKISLMLNAHHLPSIQLLILCLSALKQYREALAICETALIEYPSHLMILYIKAHLEEVTCENGRELALLTAKEMLNCWKFANSEEKTNNYECNYFLPSNYDSISLKMEQTLSEVTSLDSGTAGTAQQDVVSNNLSFKVTFGDSTNKSLWSLQMHIWILIVELFIKLGQISDADSCISDGTSGIFSSLSHQMIYIKGIISKAKGNLIEAKTHLQNAISINPKHAKALQQLGHTYYLLGNQLAAHKYLKDSLNIDATVHETWSYTGLVLQASNDHQRAVECHLTALQLEATAPVLPFTMIPRAILD